MMRVFSKFRWLGVLVLLAGLGACANDPGKLSSSASGNAAPGSVEDFNLNVGDRVFFDTDQTSLSSTARATLQRQAAWLKTYPKIKVRIEGHADERGTREYNIALGARRASTTRAYLASLGVASSRMKVLSFGKERPVATCDNISCWSQNRRAVTVVTSGAGS
jgi:peptidoglycan-associated lipoprotein